MFLGGVWWGWIRDLEILNLRVFKKVLARKEVDNMMIKKKEKKMEKKEEGVIQGITNKIMD